MLDVFDGFFVVFVAVWVDGKFFFVCVSVVVSLFDPYVVACASVAGVTHVRDLFCLWFFFE